MKCPKCKAKTGVYNSRPQENTIRRNRECPYCNHRFATIEVLAEPKVRGRPNAAPGPAKPKRIKKRRLTPRHYHQREIDRMSDDELLDALEKGLIDPENLE